MLNLLPPTEKINLQKKENYQLILILGATVLFFFITLSLILFSVEIYISGQAEAEKILADSEKERFEASETQNLEGEINLINQNLSRLDSFYESQPVWSKSLEEIAEIMPGVMYLNTLSLQPVPKKENKFQVALGGYCPTREDLYEFKRKLEEESNFNEVSFPPVSWVKSKDINFSVTFEIGL